MENKVLYESVAQGVDQRIVEYVEKDDVVELAERTAGSDTEMVFGDAVHVSVLRLDAAAQEALLGVLGGGMLVEALERLFAVEEGAYLSDVQDALDRLGVPYARAAYGPDGALYRPPFFG